MLNGSLATSLGISLNRETVRNMVIRKAMSERKLLADSLKDKFVFLKFDGVTRLRSHYLGITVQYYSSEGPVVKCLALVDTDGRSDSR